MPTSADKNLRAMDEALWLKAKAKAIQEGKTMRQLVEDLLRDYVKGTR